MRDAPLRPLLWANYADFVGGGERSLLELAEGLREAGHRPIVGVPARGEVTEAAEERGLPVRLLPAPPFRAALAAPKTFFSARRAAAEAAREVDLFHLTSPRQLPVALGLGAPWVYHLRVAARDAVLDPFLPLADAVIANSHATARRAHHARRLFVVPNGIRAEAWRVDRGKARRELRLPPHAPILACVGRATPEKGFADLAPALFRVLADNENVRVLFAGDFDTEEGRRVLLDLAPFVERICHLGRLDDVRPVYGAADLVVLPSRLEGFGRVALEAMAAGTAVCARRTGGLPEVLGDAAAWLPEPPHPARWARAIEEVLFDPERRRGLAERGRERAASFSIERTVEGVLDAYRDVLEKKRRFSKRGRRPAERPRVLFVTNDYPPTLGGMSEYARGFAEGLSAQGFDVAVLCRDFAPPPEASGMRGGPEARGADSVPVRRFRLPPRSLATGGPVGEAWEITRRLREELRRRPADLVWAITWPGWGPALRLCRVPYVVSAHGADVLAAGLRRHDRLVARTTLSGARKVFANSHFTAGVVRELLGRTAAQRVEVLYPGVEYRRFAAPPDPVRLAALRDRYGLEGKQVLLTVGALVSRKGHDLVLRALAFLEDRPDVVAAFVGGWTLHGSVERDLKALAARLAVIERTRFVGCVAEDEVPVWMHLAEVFVMPGRFDRARGWVEGFGIAYLEAGASGKPVVAAAAGGAPEAVLDGETGLVVPPEDPAALAEALARILDDETLARRLGRLGRRRAAEFDWEKRAARAAEML